MGYEVTLDKAAEKELRAFPKGEYLALIDAVSELENPLSDLVKSRSKALQGFNNLYRLVVGTRRIVYAVNHKTKQVRVVMFETRNDMYDKATKERLKGIDKSFKASVLDNEALDKLASDTFEEEDLLVFTDTVMAAANAGIREACARLKAKGISRSGL